MYSDKKKINKMKEYIKKKKSILKQEGKKKLKLIKKIQIYVKKITFFFCCCDKETKGWKILLIVY